MAEATEALALGLVQAQACPEHTCLGGVWEGSASLNTSREGGFAGEEAVQPLAKLVETTLGQVWGEGQGHVEVLWVGPAQGCSCAAYVEEIVEIVDRLLGRHDRDEGPHGATVRRAVADPAGR